MKRRSFLKSAAATAAVAPIMLGGLPARAKSSLEALAQFSAVDNDRILLVIQLFGGNDGLNTLLPLHDEDEYFKLRPRLAIPKNLAWNYQNSIYLHPALAKGSKGGFAQMLEQGNLAIVQGVGYENPNLSHFRSTDIWLSGINNSDPGARLDTGWVGRALEKRYPDFPSSLPDHPLAVQFGGFSLALLGSKGRMGIEVTDPSLQKSLTPQLDELDPASAGTAYEVEYDFIADIAARSNKYAGAVKSAYAAGQPKLQGTYAKNGFAQQIASVASLIAGGLNTKVYVVSMGGFDTHFTQQIDPNTGNHPMLLERLSDAVAQFMFDMTRLGFGDRVVGVTVSEFGRRPEENGSFGTDHGAAGVQFVFGRQVNSGVFGFAPNLRDLNANGDLNYQIDYRKVYAEILTDWFGLSYSEMGDVLRDPTIQPIDVLKAQSSGVADQSSGTGSMMSLSCSPNPFTTSTTLELTLPRAAHATIEITTLDGRSVARPLDRWLEMGRHRIALGVDLPSGVYLCTLRAGMQTSSTAIRCVR